MPPARRAPAPRQWDGVERRDSASIESVLREHTRVEEVRFAGIEAQLAVSAASLASAAATLALIAADVKSLLATREFAHGAYKVLAVLAGAVSLVVSMVVAGLRGWK